MPFINSKISVALNEAQEQEIKSRLGQAITADGDGGGKCVWKRESICIF